MALDYAALLKQGAPQPNPAVPSPSTGGLDYGVLLKQGNPQQPTPQTQPSPQPQATTSQFDENAPSGQGAQQPSTNPDDQKNLEQIMNVINSDASPQDKKTLLGFLGNIIPSAAGVAGNIGTALMHPIKTAETIGKTALGGAEKLVGGQGTPEWDAFANSLKQRYGSPENIANTLYSDPVGAALDLASLVEGGGALVGKVGEVAGLGKVAAAGKAAQEVGAAANPVGLAAKGVGKAAEAVSAPFAKSANPEAAAAFQNLGVEKPPVSALTKSPAVQGIEALAQKGLFGESVVKQLEATHAQLAEKAQELSDLAAKGADNPQFLSTAEELLRGGFDEAKDKFNAVKTKLYEDAAPAMKEIPAVTSETKSSLDAVIGGKEQSLLPADILKKLNTLRDNLASSSEAGQNTFDKLKETRTDIGALLKGRDPIVRGNEAIWNKLYASLSSDMDKSLVAAEKTMPGITRKVKAANDYYKAGLDQFNGPVGRALSKAKSGAFLDAILEPKDVGHVRLAKTMIGKENEPLLQAALLKKIIDPAVHEGSLNATKLASGMKKYDAILKEVLTPEQMKTLADLQTASGAVKSGQRMATGSQTAFLGKLGALGAAATIGPHKLLLLLLGDAAAERAMQTDLGRKFLTTGLPGAGSKFAKLSGKAKVAAQLGRQAQAAQGESQ